VVYLCSPSLYRRSHFADLGRYYVVSDEETRP
jgi:hypothetical protein